ncbi:endonuclease domain-containing protein [Pelagerythrobacter marensis]|uniref:Endonuclease domain-containing protein n=1 Tax=Pelagerythrobacter marensis TaxID=543877 RepID=A0ABZ2D251_9SPHN
MPRTKRIRDIGRARRLRAEMSLPEVLLWQELRRKACDIKFRRQHPLGRYVLDFYVAALKLAIEIDGQAHDMGDRPERDIARDRWLRAQNIEVIRIPASEVLRDANEIADSIVRYCQSK